MGNDLNCPRCNGFYYHHKEIEGVEYHCLNCGYVDYGQEFVPIPHQEILKPVKALIQPSKVYRRVGWYWDYKDELIADYEAVKRGDMRMMELRDKWVIGGQMWQKIRREFKLVPLKKQLAGVQR